MKISYRLLMIIVILLVSSCLCHGFEFGKLSIKGYSTLGVSWDDHDDLIPLRDIFQNLEDSNDLTWELDSRVGVQARYNLFDSLYFVTQGVYTNRAHSNFDSILSSAFVAYRFKNLYEIRLGRLPFNTLLLGNNRNLGFSYMWVRPPVETYAAIPVFAVDGAQVSYVHSWNRYQVSTGLQLGHYNVYIPLDRTEYNMEMDLIMLGYLQIQRGTFRVKLSQTYAHIDSASPLMGFTPAMQSIMDATETAYPKIYQEAENFKHHLQFNDQAVYYTSIGASYETENWSVQTEYTHSNGTTNVIPHGNSFYACVGRNIGKVTPYIMYSMIRPTHDTVNLKDKDWSVLGEGAEGLLRSAIGALNGAIADQESKVLGVKYNLSNSTILKLQYDAIKIAPNGSVLWRHTANDTRPEHNYVNLLSLNMEILF